MIQLDMQSRVPIYEQLINGVTRLRALGLLNADQQLPSVRALAVELGINPNTVQKAYQILEARQIIYSVTGKGSFISAADTAVAAAIKTAGERARSALTDAARIGYTKENALRMVNEVYTGISAPANLN